MLQPSKILLYTLALIFVIARGYAQNRNEGVSQLNRIIDLMDEASLQNRSAWHDIDVVADHYTRNREKRNDYIWYVYNNTGIRVQFTREELQFPELHPDSAGYINVYEYELYPYLVARRDIRALMAKKNLLNDAIEKSIASFISCADSLISHHLGLRNYISEKRFKQDTDFSEARRKIDELQPWFDRYHTLAAELYGEIVRYCNEKFPPTASQPLTRNAAGELRKTITIMDEWEKELYAATPRKALSTTG